MGYGMMHQILMEDLQMSKVILSYKFDFYMMHVEKVSDHSYNIVNRYDSSKESSSVLCRTLSSFKPNFRTVWTSWNSGSIVIAVVSSAKEIILRRS